MFIVKPPPPTFESTLCWTLLHLSILNKIKHAPHSPSASTGINRLAGYIEPLAPDENDKTHHIRVHSDELAGPYLNQ